MRILVVEDERPIAEFIQRGLEAEGYSVACAFDGEEGLAMARSGDYSLVVLDVLLPKLSGLEVVKGIRETDEVVPVIMLTALADTREVDRDGRRVSLTAREFELLAYLMRYPDQVLSRAQILNAVWGYDYDPGTNVLDVYIGYLRKKLAEADGEAPIETVRSAGFRLVSADA
jgi:DNA-binding response OmpR family regulator